MNFTSNSKTKSSIIERRPVRMLKEFLRDDDQYSNSTNPTVHNQQPPPPPPASLQRSRSRSRAAAEAAVSSFQKLLISAVTKFRRSKKKSSKSTTYSGEGKIIKVKDILRWRSFRDEDKKSPPSNSPGTTTLASSTTGGSEFSFTADELPWWWGKGKSWNNEVDVLEGRDLVRQTTGTEDGPQVGPEEDNLTSEEEKEQHSPVSVLNSPFRDEVSDEECSSYFDQSLANVERTKQRLLESIQWLESLAGVDEQSSLDDDLEAQDQEEEQTNGEGEKEEEDIDEENGSEARSRVYMFKVLSKLSRGGQGVKGIEGCFREMETQGQWSKFGEEREEVGQELGACLLHDLVDEVFLDLFG